MLYWWKKITRLNVRSSNSCLLLTSVCGFWLTLNVRASRVDKFNINRYISRKTVVDYPNRCDEKKNYNENAHSMARLDV